MTPKADTKKPTSTAPTVTALPDGSARIEWTTNEATTGTVDLGRSAKKLTTSAAESGATRRHSLLVTDLAPDSSYWIRTTSTDAAGNAVSSKKSRFTTPAAGVAEQTTASFRRGETTGQATIDDAGLGSVTLAGGSTKSRRGVFTSGVLDAQAMVDWDRMVSRSVSPQGSALVVRVRTGRPRHPTGPGRTGSRSRATIG